MQTEIRMGLLALATGLTLASCGGTEGELLEAINVDEETPLCLTPETIGVNVFQANDGNRYFAEAEQNGFGFGQSNIKSLPALQKKGYASKDATSFPSGFRSINAFAVKDKFLPYIGEFEQVCLGNMYATEIIEYTEPPEAGPQVIQARFKYKIEFNKLVDDLDIEDELIDGPVGRSRPGVGTATYIKTNKGWRSEMTVWVD